VAPRAKPMTWRGAHEGKAEFHRHAGLPAEAEICDGQSVRQVAGQSKPTCVKS
jgi:hypothetical protein